MNALPETKNPLSNGKVVDANVRREDYCRQLEGVKRGDPSFVMSRGELMEFNHCPHRWLMGYKSEPSKASDWGSLIDCLALTPERCAYEFAVTPKVYPCEPSKKDPRTEKPWNRNATYCSEWEEAQEGKQIVKDAEMTEAMTAVDVLMEDAQVADLVRGSGKQVMVVAEYRDEDTGIVVPVKTLLDLVPSGQFEKAIADLKTCCSADARAWVKAVFDNGYHAQSALYMDAWNVATGEERLEFYHILQENYAPWETAKRMLSQEYIELGRMQYLAALKRYCQCLQAKTWPGYSARMEFGGWQLVEPLAYMVGE